MRRAYLAGLCLLMAGCSSGSDRYSDAANLEVHSDGSVTPKNGAAALGTATVAFTIGDGYKLHGGAVIPSAGSALVFRSGAAYMCVKNKKDDFFQCDQPRALVPDDQGVGFPLRDDGQIRAYVHALPGTLGSPNGDVEMPAGTLRLTIGGVLADGTFYPPTLGAYRLEYLSLADSRDAFKTLDGKTISF